MSLLSILVYSLLQSPSCNLEYHLNDIKWHQISRATWAFTFARITRTNGEKYRISHAPSLYPSRSLAPSSSSFYSLCISRATRAFPCARITRTNGEKYMISHAPSLYPSRSLAPSSSSFYSLCISNASIVLSNISIFWRRLLLSKQTFFVLSDTAKPDSSLELTFLRYSISVLEQRLERNCGAKWNRRHFLQAHRPASTFRRYTWCSIFMYFRETREEVKIFEQKEECRRFTIAKKSIACGKRPRFGQE